MDRANQSENASRADNALQDGSPLVRESAAENETACHVAEHLSSAQSAAPLDEAAIEQASRIFRALGEASRLRLATRLAAGPACVSELAGLERESITTISQRLRVLRSDNIVRRRRDGKHMLYSLADQHVLDLVSNGLAHVSEPHTPSVPNDQTLHTERTSPMTTDHATHADHTHLHGADCGHIAVKHDDHVDYLHDGHLHHPHENHIDEHKIEVSQANPDKCTDGHACNGHDAAHKHGADCGHEAVPHGDHTDYLVAGHLHHQHNGHCDNHGNITVQ